MVGMSHRETIHVSRVPGTVMVPPAQLYAADVPGYQCIKYSLLAPDHRTDRFVMHCCLRRCKLLILTLATKHLLRSNQQKVSASF